MGGPERGDGVNRALKQNGVDNETSVPWNHT
jgi:hypothetical protein